MEAGKCGGCGLQRFFYQSQILCRHPPQSITPPLIVTLIPMNDVGPTLDLDTSELTYNETAAPLPVFLGLDVSDLDSSICNPEPLTAAQVVIRTISSDTEVLRVS